MVFENLMYLINIKEYLKWFCNVCSFFLQTRLAVNSVIVGDFSRPCAISTFITDLGAGFRLLNLKNDALRRRFDGLKYDVKKVEEVVYDITIRGLKPDS